MSADRCARISLSGLVNRARDPRNSSGRGLKYLFASLTESYTKSSKVKLDLLQKAAGKTGSFWRNVDERDPEFINKALNVVKLVERFATMNSLNDFNHILRPSMPEGPLKATNIFKNLVILSWHRPKLSSVLEVDYYVVESKVDGDDIWNNEAIIRESERCVLENLSVGISYHFRVYAVNSWGSSEPLEFDGVHRLFSVPSQPQGPLILQRLGTNRVQISWLMPEFDGGCPIKSFKVFIRDTSGKTWFWYDSNGDTTIIIKNLQEKHSYNFRVVAYNKIGQSDPLASEIDSPFMISGDGPFFTQLLSCNCNLLSTFKKIIAK